MSKAFLVLIGKLKKIIKYYHKRKIQKTGYEHPN